MKNSCRKCAPKLAPDPFLTLCFLSNPTHFNGQKYQKQRDQELVTSRSSGYKTFFRKVTLLVIKKTLNFKAPFYGRVQLPQG